MREEKKIPKISVILITLNEEKNLPFALRSVHEWADEIIVVDMHSEDKTVEIAKQYGAKVYFHERVPAFDIARKLAIEKAANEYIFSLDADEIVTKPLVLTLLYMAEKNVADIVYVPRINYMFGEIMRHTWLAPNEDYQLRLFKKDKVKICDTIHGFFNVVPGSKIHHLKYVSDEIAIIHFTVPSISKFLKKFDHFGSVEAEQFMKNNNYDIDSMIKWALREFFNTYIEKDGFKDGWRGFFWALNLSFSKIVRFIKMEELKGNLGEVKILNKYHKIANNYLESYKDDIEKDYRDNFNTFEINETKQPDIQYGIIASSGLFDRNYYIDTYQDVKLAGIDPIWHYITHGSKENRNPAGFFDTKYYIENYKDVAESGLNPLVHYILYGKMQNRKTKK